MPREEREKMVTENLSNFNKSLTTDESNKLLGNQMKMLIDKNSSALYLCTATEALRTQGIYEEMTQYIQKLPTTVPKLFGFLIDNWADVYGEEFVRYLLCIIKVSRNGVLENTLNDILDYIEKARNADFKCTFSTVFDSLRGFLSSGGEGYLRFFHDQLNKKWSRKNI